MSERVLIRLLVICVVTFLVSTGAVVYLVLNPPGSGPEAEQVEPGPFVEAPLPSFGPLTDRSGEQYRSEDLAGKPMIVTFFFTRCADFCPQLIGRKALLQRQLREKPWWGEVRLVSISVDPEHDTPEVLSRYAERFDADTDHWLFLSGESFEQIAQIKRDAFRLPEPTPDPDREHQIAHTDRMVLVDADGAIWGYFPGLDEQAHDLLLMQLDALMSDGETPEVDAGPHGTPRSMLADGSLPSPVGRGAGGEGHDFRSATFSRTRSISAAGGKAARTGALEVPSPSGAGVVTGSIALTAATSPTAWGLDLSGLPAVNAGLNTVAIVLLVGGFVMIRRKQVRAHRNFMIGAFAVSALFLALYVLHKAWRSAAGGDLHAVYHGEGLLRGAYLVILLTHVVLAMAVPVLAIWLIWLAVKNRFDRHRRLARWAYPVWMYVSVTGVVIYLMLYPFNPVPGS